jgi:hypothetical protein
MHMFWATWRRFRRFALLAGPSNDSVLGWWPAFAADILQAGLIGGR